MARYTEVYRFEPTQDPGHVFYTITAEDVGKRSIRTAAGTISVTDVIGQVLAGDVGKRLYRVPCDDPAAGWIWQAENDKQRDERLAREDGGR